MASSLPFLHKQTGLNKVVKVDLLEKEPSEKVKIIWQDYHKHKDCIFSTIESTKYKHIRERSRKSPMFVFPVPLEKGFVSILGQATKPSPELMEDHYVFTLLDEYQKKGVASEPYLDMVCYTDFMESKGIVLMRAPMTSTRLTRLQAQYLVNLWQLFLIDDDKYELMEQFNHKPNEFDFQKVVEKVQQLASSGADNNSDFNFTSNDANTNEPESNTKENSDVNSKV